MKRSLITLIVLIVCILNNANSAHITGGKFRYFYLGGTEYKIQLQLERDCASGGANFETSTVIGMYSKSDDRKITQFSLVKDSVVNIASNPHDCSQTITRCYEVGYFSAIVNTNGLLALAVNFDSLGYYFNWERCCLNDEIVNIVDPGSTPFSAILDVPKLTLQSGVSNPFVNSSPYFNKEFNPLLCLNSDFNYNLSFIDPDGDSLVYELIKPYAGKYTSTSNPMQRSGPKPYDNIEWNTGFDDTTIISAEPKLKIDAKSGVLTAKPNELGKYIFAIAVHEYRNGELLGTVYYESMLWVYNCAIAIIQQPKNQYAHQNSEVIFHVKHSTSSATYQWEELKNSTSKILVGETNDTLFLPNVSSDMHNNKYRCIISTQKPCKDTSNYATLNVLGLGIENEKPQDLVLYPNPSQSLVYFSDQSPKNIKVLSSDGRLLLQNNQVNQIDISSLSKGLYIIKLESLDEKHSWVKQIIKQ